MSLMTQARNQLAFRVHEPPDRQRPVFAQSALAASHAAMVTRFCKVVFTIILFVAVVFGIVTLRSAVWTPGILSAVL
jgi:hypothetical protein